jgi:hypothetical protein
MSIRAIPVVALALFVLLGCGYHSKTTTHSGSSSGSPTMTSAGATVEYELTGADVDISVDKSTYTLDDTVLVTIHNNASVTLYFHLGCDGSIEGLSDASTQDEWEFVFRKDCSHIRVRPTEVAPRGTTTEAYYLSELPPIDVADYIDYRVEIRINGVPMYSPPFSLD